MNKLKGNARDKRSVHLGIASMLLAMAMLSTMDALAKWLIENAVHTVQILALRSLIIVPALLLVYALRNTLAELKPARPVAQAVRGLIGFLAPLCFFMGISYMPLTTAVVIFFSSIFLTTLSSVIFLGERVGLHRWIAVVTGYIGVFIAIRPSAGGSLLGYLLVLFASLMYTVVFISGRRLSATDSVPSLVLSYNLYGGLVALLLLPWFWRGMSAEQWFWVVMLSVFAVAGHFFVTHAFSIAEASLISPFEYTCLIWTVLFDILIWNELPGSHTWLGAVIIVGSGLYVLYREHRQVRGSG